MVFLDAYTPPSVPSVATMFRAVSSFFFVQGRGKTQTGRSYVSSLNSWFGEHPRLLTA